MPSAAARPTKFVPDDDGRFRCHEPGCTTPVATQDGYALPNGLGIHRLRAHGRPGQAKSSQAARRAAAGLTVRKQTHSTKSVSTNGHRPQPERDVETICRVVLAELIPSGNMPVAAVGAYMAWVHHTEEFMDTLKALT
jgi:hypothetical protein